jgi:ribosome maturation factor RimP
MAVNEHITQLIETPIISLGYELVGVEYISKGNDSVVRIYIDAEAGIGIEDCERVSHQVSGILEVEDPISSAYTLEVSSPGFDRPLFKLTHYEQFSGNDAKVTLKLPIEGRRNFTGQLQGIEDSDVLILVDGEIYALPFNRITKAKLVV